MRKTIIYFCGLLFCLSLLGCGDESDLQSMLKLKKNGQVTGIIVEEFDKSYYDVTELEEMIRVEIAEYNTNAGSERITLESIEVLDGMVRAKFCYTTYADYAAFNETDFFAGTVEEAKALGINLNHVMVEAGKNNTISPQQLEELSEYNLVMWQDNILVEVPAKILYHTEDLTLQGSKKIISGSDSEGPFYLIYK